MSIPSTPSSVKKLEKQLTKEAKREDKEVKHTLKDIQSLEKQKTKTQKVLSPHNVSRLVLKPR